MAMPYSTPDAADDGTVPYRWRCRLCGESFDTIPTSVQFRYPDHWLDLDEVERDRRPNFATEDFCLIEHENRTDRFVRCILEVPIVGQPDSFLWGVWVSLSETNFEWVQRTWSQVEPPEFRLIGGYVCNEIPLYPADPLLKANVELQPQPLRPLVFLHRCDHRLYQEQNEGMTMDRVVELAPHLLKHRCPP